MLSKPARATPVTIFQTRPGGRSHTRQRPVPFRVRRGVSDRFRPACLTSARRRSSVDHLWSARGARRAKLRRTSRAPNRMRGFSPPPLHRVADQTVDRVHLRSKRLHFSGRRMSGPGPSTAHPIMLLGANSEPVAGLRRPSAGLAHECGRSRRWRVIGGLRQVAPRLGVLGSQTVIIRTGTFWNP